MMYISTDSDNPLVNQAYGTYVKGTSFDFF